MANLPVSALAEPISLSTPLADRTRALIAAAKAPSTLRAYRSDWVRFFKWCETQQLTALPASPETVALFLAAQSFTHRPASLARKLSAIAKTHEAAGFPSPASRHHAPVAEVMAGIRRTYGTAPLTKTPLLTGDLRRLLACVRDGLAGLRDRALLLAGFAGGFRRSELAALRVGDVEQVTDGLILHLRRSKTDPEGQGRKVALPYGSSAETCPVRALMNWIDEAGLKEGALFRAIDRHGRVAAKGLHPDSVGWILKQALGRAGFDPAVYGGHSLRAGLVTQAYLNGASEWSIMKQTGHRSVAMVRRYIREASLFENNPAAKLGL